MSELKTDTEPDPKPDPRYLFIIYSCYKNLANAELIYNFLISKNFQEYCKIYIIYGNLSRKEFQDATVKYIQLGHHLILNTPDDYYSLNKKTLALFQTIQEMYSSNATRKADLIGIFKCDDDIIPNVPHLVNLISYSKLADVDYCGNKIDVQYAYDYDFNNNPKYKTTFPVVRYCGGPLYYISARALNTFTVGAVKIFPAEDVMVGYHLNHAGIEPTQVINSLYTDEASNMKKLSFHNYKHETQYLERIKIPASSITIDTNNNQIDTLYSISLGILCPQINGGLGNQLFKIGAAISLARQYNRELIISKAHFIPNGHQTAVKTMETLAKLFCKPELPLRIIDCNIPGGHYVYKAGATESFQYVDLSARIPNEIIQGRGNIMLDGYFINPRYLPDDYPNLISISPTRKASHLAAECDGFKNTYFIHIRLGDYVGNELYRIPLETYYLECIAQIKQINPAAQFIVCTNEYSTNLDKYMKQIKKIANCNIQSKKDDELDTLYIMSQCCGGICANSTLSWFGAYFQQARINAASLLEAKKHIYMPYPWVNYTPHHGFTNENTSDIYPTWARVYNTLTSSFRD